MQIAGDDISVGSKIIHMSTLWELLSDENRGDAIACRLGDERIYDYHRFLTTAWKAGNYLRHFGVREDVVVGITDHRIPEPLFAALGSWLLGGLVWFEPPLGADLRVLVCPASNIDSYDSAVGFSRIAYGGSTEDESIEHFEEGLWSQNPTIPPERPSPRTRAFTTGNRSYTQRCLLDAASRFSKDKDLEEGMDVVIRSSLTNPGTIVAILGTIHSTATLVLPPSGSESDADTATSGDVTIGEGPETNVVDTERIAPSSE
jgi:hypothetical protein